MGAFLSPHHAKIAENNFVMGSFRGYCEYPPFGAFAGLLESIKHKKRGTEMSNRYEHFNEITFNAYCMIAIENAVKRGLRKKKLRAQREISFSALEENIDVSFDPPDNGLSAQDMAADVFEINGLAIPVMDEALAKALRLIPPQRRNIVLLSYLMGKNDVEIGKVLNLARTTVRDRRHDSMEKLQELMRDKV